MAATRGILPMKNLCKVLTIVAGVLIAGYLVAEDSPKKEARVTRIIRDVKVLPSGSAARPAALDERVRENTGVRTGDESRSELTFADLTITRLGANTVFSFNRAGRSAELGNGSMLLRVPKDSGGATIRTSAITVGITGTTVIFEGNRAGRSKLIVLEGGASLQLVKYPKESKRVLAGQMLDVKAGATTLPDPVTVDLRQIMKSHPLITDFPPLPSQALIVAAMQNQQGSAAKGERVYPSNPVTGQPVGGQPTGYVPPLIGGGAVFPLPGGRGSHPTHDTGSRGSAGSKSTPAQTTHLPGSKGTGGSKSTPATTTYLPGSRGTGGSKSTPATTTYLPGKPSPKQPVRRALPTPTPPTTH
jgi:hypothetical protein